MQNIDPCQVLEARNHLGNRIFRQCIHQMPNEIVEVRLFFFVSVFCLSQCCGAGAGGAEII